MKIDVTAKTTLPLDIEPEEAFKILCKTLSMNCVLNEDIDFFVRESCYGDRRVYYIKDGHDEEYDYRGDLFIALRNVAVNIFPNVSFR
jgi:hypothetical protein